MLNSTVLASTRSCTLAPRHFLRASSTSPGVPPKAPRLRRCAAVWSFHFCVGNGNSTLSFTPLTFEPWEGRRQIDAAECFCRTKSYTRPATCCALLNSLTDPEAASERNSLLTLNQLVWRSPPLTFVLYKPAKIARAWSCSRGGQPALFAEQYADECK